MGYRLESDTVREIALSMMTEVTAWDYADQGDAGYIKTAMYNQGIMDMANRVIEAIEELKKA